MRPPLYTGFLAACIYLLGDWLCSSCAWIQAIIGALTVVPAYALTATTVRQPPRRAGRRAAAGRELYAWAANATELLTETPVRVWADHAVLAALLADDRRPSHTESQEVRS